MHELTSRKEQHPLIALPKTMSQKVEKKVLLTDLSAMQQRQIGVLLYEPTTELPHREMQCESWCAIVLDDERFSDIRTIRVQPGSWQQLTVFLDLKKYTTSRIRLYNPRSVITFVNRKRGSDQFPLNYFRGDIAIQYEKYTTIDKKERIGRTVINHVFMDDYLRGLAETVEEQHSEKLRTMALLVKGYISFYVWGNRHPSVPEWVSYQAIDDPRLFQKYIGAGGEQTMPHWHQALEKTISEYVVYDAYVPLLPFFHCSAWFIRSWKEAFWWTDTPWLVSKLDVASCETSGFEWHGVGLSGDGAERLAQAWATYQQILRYYYPWVKIVSIK
jgi:peptidoglycan hydrolase-like amidase